jgi:tripartite-type tricarboxylate transporter receptor subunit TctC
MRNLNIIAVIAATLALTTIAQAQDWPSRPVTMVVPGVCCGSSDVLGRILVPRLSELLGQEIVIENIGGAGGMTGTSRVAKSPADGYAFIIGNVGTFAINQTLYKYPLYDAAIDFAPVALIAETPILLVTRNGLPANSIRDLVAYANANQATVRFGSAGPGSASHLVCVLVNAALGIKATHVPSAGGGPAMQDLIAGRIDYWCPDTTNALPYIQSKSVKAIAILTRDRSPSLPVVASAAEQGLTNFAPSNWFAFFFPRGVPAPIVQKFHDASLATVNSTAIQARMTEAGADLIAPERRSPEYLQRFVESEIAKWRGVIKAANVSAD